ncbi:Detected protein of unknown function [Hibiscus syriacus]|uniref:Uncharacterized protein n=1 Tax=Hibiscus syriacus TaxID=106335 RepID=A0A6A3CQL7_HIBSY|nr:Detected protein of unknown function [Hibiscus syriacus]
MMTRLSGNNIPSERCHSVPRATRTESNSSRSRNLEERSNETPVKPNANEAWNGSDAKGSKVAYKNLRMLFLLVLILVINTILKAEAEGACRSSEQLRHSALHLQSAKAKSDMASHCTSKVNDSAQNKWCRSSAVQALLRVQVKNGLPLFTFAVDNESNILAATVKMLSASGKGDYGCIYTFFSIQEVRRKNQSKGQANPQGSDFQSSNEQAAIVVKIPKRNRRFPIRDGYLIDKRNSLAEATLKEHRPGVKLEFGSGKNGPLMDGPDISATVILPSGVHSLPNKGEPSSLIQRWKSAGACDCGGWDLGCKLGVLSNKSQFSHRSNFELFLEDQLLLVEAAGICCGGGGCWVT